MWNFFVTFLLSTITPTAYILFKLNHAIYMARARSTAQGNNIKENKGNLFKSLKTSLDHQPILAFYHLQMNTGGTDSDLLNIPSPILPLIKQYGFLFSETIDFIS